MKLQFERFEMSDNGLGLKDEKNESCEKYKFMSSSKSNLRIQSQNMS